MTDFVTLAHGAGGKQTAELIDRVFKSHFANPNFTGDDAAVLPAPQGRIAMTTDGFIVSPRFFPGGNIGKLAICGTVNDLTCMGAKPLYMTSAFVIEEGFPMDELEEIVAAMEKTAAEVGVQIVAGDTKVAGKGQVDGVIITTGDVGRHGCTILLARDEYGIEADVKSDCAPLWNAIHAAFEEVPEIHTVRDATRGGVGTVLYEIAEQSNVGIRLDAARIPVEPEVRGVCGMLGLEPLYLACEGTMVIIVPEEKAEKVLDVLHRQKYTENAAAIGTITEDQKGRVVMTTEIGSETLLPQPGNELLPRIC